MSENGSGNHQRNFFQWNAKAPKLLVTTLIFTVFGLFCFLLITEIPNAWESCIAGFPALNSFELVLPTVTNAYVRALPNFRDFFLWEPTFKLACAAFIWSGLKKGMPLVRLAPIVWLSTFLPLALFLSQNSMPDYEIQSSDYFAIVVGICISTLCGHIAKKFW